VSNHFKNDRSSIQKKKEQTKKVPFTLTGPQDVHIILQLKKEKTNNRPLKNSNEGLPRKARERERRKTKYLLSS